MKQELLSLVQSRKFWLTVVTVAGSIYMYFRHGITADQLANVLTASSGVLVASIAIKEHGDAVSSVPAVMLTPPPANSGKEVSNEIPKS